MSITIRNYQVSDWNAIQKIHDESRKIELKLAGLEDAFLPLCIAAERENLLIIQDFLLRKRMVRLLAL